MKKPLPPVMLLNVSIFKAIVAAFPLEFHRRARTARLGAQPNGSNRLIRALKRCRVRSRRTTRESLTQLS